MSEGKEGMGASSPRLPSLIDPTENVKALNKASSRHLREMLRLEISGIRREIMNQARLVARVRKIDRLNQRLTDERLQASTDKLAATIELTAKTLAGTVAETAKTLGKSVSDSFDRLSERVTILEKGQYEGAGQAGERDPQIKALMAEVAELRVQRASGAGVGTGLSMGAKILIAAIGFMATLLGLVATALGIFAYMAR